MAATTLEIPQNTYSAQFTRLQGRSRVLRSEPVRARAERLKKLDNWLTSNQKALEEAVFADLGKPAMEVMTTEVFPVLSEIRHALANLEKWASPTKIDAPLTFIGTRSEVRYEPKGVCLIIAPWNYPFNLCIGPLVSCLAAGNTALIKPSEMTPATSKFVNRMIPEIFEPDVVSVVEGDASVAADLLRLPFDHIFFTGSPTIGKVVMRAAAENLTSVTLELGGKSPAIVDSTADLKDAAKRIAFSRFFNNGQTCIAPDYVIIENSIKDRFIDLLKANIEELFGRGGRIDQQSPDYARIVNEKHFARVNNLVRDAINKGATPVVTGEFDQAKKFIPPTVLTDVTNDMLVMEEEIFGPVLPVLGVDSKEASLEIVNSKPKPLSLYIFSYDKPFRERVLKETSAGGVCINDCVLQFAHPNLPFGGVNNSGLGKAHGHAGFLSFSNEKPVVRQKSGYSNAYFFYPPYTSVKRRLVDLMMRWFI